MSIIYKEVSETMQKHFKATIELLEDQLLEAKSTILAMSVDKDKTIRLYQDVADMIVRRGIQLEKQVAELKKNQKKTPGRKRKV